MSFNKASGIDQIPIRVIKDCLTSILPTLTAIVNFSLSTSTFPAVWKISEVTPIPKDGDHEQAVNNRPVSLLYIPVLSKVCERVAYNQLTSYLLENERLTKYQSGNKKWHSTETSVIQTIQVQSLTPSTKGSLLLWYSWI